MHGLTKVFSICIILIYAIGCANRHKIADISYLMNIKQVEIRHGSEISGINLENTEQFMKLATQIFGPRLIGISKNGEVIQCNGYDLKLSLLTIIYIGDGKDVTKAFEKSLISLFGDVRGVNGIDVDSFSTKRDKYPSISPGDNLYAIVQKYKTDNK